MAAAGRHVRPNQADLPVTLTPTGLGTADWSYPVNNLPSVNYEIRGFSTDSFGNTSDPLVTTFAVNGGAACNIALDGNDDPVISWTNFDSNNVTQVFLRRDGRIWQPAQLVARAIPIQQSPPATTAIWFVGVQTDLTSTCRVRPTRSRFPVVAVATRCAPLR